MLHVIENKFLLEEFSNPYQPEIEAYDIFNYVIFYKSLDLNQVDLSLLSQSEMQRAKRFVREIDRENFIFRRFLLKKIICKLNQVSSKSIIIKTHDSGKPYLISRGNVCKLHFNQSKSNKSFLFSFSKEHQLGVDIEQIRKNNQIHDIVALFFSSSEKAWFFKIRENKRLNYFFYLWTAKEALAKCDTGKLFQTLPVPISPTIKQKVICSFKQRDYFIYSFEVKNYKITLAMQYDFKKIKTTILDLC